MGSINLYENGALNPLNGSGIVTCEYEEAAAALKSRAIGDILYIKINNVFGTYKVIKAIAKDDPITTTGANANIEEFNSVGKQLFVKDLPGGEGSGGEAVPVLKATYEETTALSDHDVDKYLYINEHFYKVTASIDEGDPIAVGTNITANLDLPEDTEFNVSGIPGSDTESIFVLDTLDSTSTRDALSANQGRVLDEKISALNSNLIKYVDFTVSFGAISANDGAAISTHQYLIDQDLVPNDAIFINAVSKGSALSNTMVEFKYMPTGYMSGQNEWAIRIYAHSALSAGNYDFRVFYI